MEIINEEDYMPFVPMIEPTLDDLPFVPMDEPTLVDAYLDNWITKEQLLEIFLNEPDRLSEKDWKMLNDDNSTLERIIHQHDVARCLRAQ
jgi:hypothetical protein